MQSCTCIIPFYNEKDRIFSVLDVVTNTKNITQVICVDDASIDDTSKLIESKYKNVQVIRIPVNGGKAQAVYKGLAYAQSDTILLLDADLKWLSGQVIEEAIDAFHTLKIDLILFRRQNEPLWAKVIRADTVISGERMLRKADLLEIYKQPLDHYQLDVAINRYMTKHHKIVYWAQNATIHTMKYKKSGLIKGTAKEVLMLVNLMHYLSPAEFVTQLLLFGRKQLRV